MGVFATDRHQTSSSLTNWCPHSKRENDREGGGLLSAGDSKQIKASMCLITCSALWGTAGTEDKV